MISSNKKAIGLSLPLQLGSNGYFATNSDTISQISTNIRNILLTKPGERRFNNQFGSGLYNLLFDGLEQDLNKNIIIDVLQRDVDKFLNDTSILDVKLTKDQSNNINNSIFISITFRYNNTVGTSEFILNNNRI